MRHLSRFLSTFEAAHLKFTDKEPIFADLSVNGKYAAAIFSKFKKSIAIGHPGFYQKHVASKYLVRITLIISIFKEIMQQKRGICFITPLVYTCTNFDVFVDIIL